MRRQCYVNVANWDTSSTEWHQLLLQLPDHDQKQVMRYVFEKDQKLALGSRLLQRKLIQEVSGLNYDAIKIARTPENKPYWNRDRNSLAPLLWNYNVSHHGTIVAIASDSRALVGVDVVRLTDRPNQTTSIHDFIRAFKSHFNPREWKYIRGSSIEEEDDQYKRFYRLWSLKEAYIKAVGVGLGFSLLRAEFNQVKLGRDDQWNIILDGQQSNDWHFTSTQVDDVHLISVAYGPFSAMWKPETSSIFPIDPLTDEQSVASIEQKTISWQEWTLQNLLQ
ncbi:l-aminoadipate-semialdehyde dehydrogenase-phosphopantetheinyl [Plasmopara halstedii]|uniref:holo-[acyl-carrier-protein] synthase n=1 Tax=Plasmopara halstedii TaxID=4781 RepID=A0A0N7L8C9_PLAHL|nr:l-aminoadipate-semialdehyde dehydrogenase-phosphopantetheinyl [Plasmopara halstedii]CEG49523.1 l-aminoadipate-semialdehyde dehydrogenase-phosphopantetheinyl [Plasmopara halstedii]|eukprot:XP_024585892.1 l-aminoadipate-semialdehyde dehydrogenase-phosphopantetheinyl [Plasmopara halstedii]